ncbi:MAG: hypothetical protein ACQEV6_17915 [Pseudomonadota bacterium]
MLIDFDGMDPKDACHILTQTVIPRPVTTTRIASVLMALQLTLSAASGQ